MDTELRSVGGQVYKGRDPIENIFVDKKNRTAVIGQRDHTKRSAASILLGKVIERVPATDYFDYNLWLDTQFPHIVFIAGKRGSGKSYDLGLILEGLNAESSNYSQRPTEFASILFDLQSQFWSFGQPLRKNLREDAEQRLQVDKWNLVGEQRQPVFYLPVGSQAIVGNEVLLKIPPRSLTLSDWLTLLSTGRFEPLGQLIAITIQAATQANPSFEIEELVEVLNHVSRWPDFAAFQSNTIDALRWRLLALAETKLFQSGELLVESLLRPGQCSVVLMRELPDYLKAIVVAVVMRHVERVMSRYHQKRRVSARSEVAHHEIKPSRVWVLIDEAHLVCPSVNKTSANEVIVDYVKRGRDAGLSLILASQQPSAVDTAAISQVDLSILHKLTIDADIVAATARLPSPLPSGVRVREKDVSDPRLLIRELLPGEALVSDSEANRTFIARMRPRVTPHSGGEPLL